MNDPGLAEQLGVTWNDIFHEELTTHDVGKVRSGLERAITALNQQDKSIGRLKLGLTAAVLAILALGGIILKPKPEDTSMVWNTLTLETTPIATWVEGSDGLVKSPFSNSGFVDVRGFQPGSKVRCPMTGKLFIIPEKPISDKTNTFLQKYEQ